MKKESKGSVFLKLLQRSLKICRLCLYGHGRKQSSIVGGVNFEEKRPPGSSSGSCSGSGSVQNWTYLCALDITEGSDMVNNL